MYSIGIDLGGTVVKIGLVHQGEIVESVRLESQASRGLASNLPRIKKEIDEMLSQTDRSRLKGIGLAFPGLVNPKEAKVISTNEKYDDACRLDLRAWVEEQWNVPFYMDNDARLAVVGEWRCGAAAGRDNVVMMTLGTGIGTGVVIDGKVLHGKHYQAGSLGGHFVIDYKGRSCNCGNKGCVEALASTFFLPTIIREHPALSDSFKAEAARYDFSEIFRLAADGDKEALLLRDECMDVWSAAVITYIHAYDPEVVVMGGGVMNSRDVILPYIKEKVSRYAWCPSEEVAIVCSRLKDNAALMGLDYYLTQLTKEQHHEATL
jgi:glucokinase